MIRPPNPGSDEACKLGCRCPRIDNSYGAGYLGGVTHQGSPVFVYSDDCPLHNPPPPPRRAA